MGQVDSSKASGDDPPMVSDLQDRQFRKYEVHGWEIIGSETGGYLNLYQFVTILIGKMVIVHQFFLGTVPYLWQDWWLWWFYRPCLWISPGWSTGRFSLSKKDHVLLQQDGSLQSNPTKDLVTGGEILQVWSLPSHPLLVEKGMHHTNLIDVFQSRSVSASLKNPKMKLSENRVPPTSIGSSSFSMVAAPNLPPAEATMTAEQANFYLQGQKYDDALLGVVGSWVVGEGLPIHNSWVINMYNTPPKKQANKLRTSNLWQCLGKQHPLHAGRHSSMLFKGCWNMGI